MKTVTIFFRTMALSALILVTVESKAQCTASFSYTQGSNGLINFINTSTGTVSGTIYRWHFGDGFYSSTMNPSHTYINAGMHNVTLYVENPLPVRCWDSVYHAVPVTGVPCVANSNFTLTPSSTPKFWYVIPSYPGNVTNATWSWGDNTTSNGIYSAHQYSVAGNYNICLSVTVSCGSTSSSCATYSVFRSAANMINVTVKAPAIAVEITGINKNVANSSDIKVFPNPNNGLFNLSVKNLNSPQTNVITYNMVGQQVFNETYLSESNELNKQLDLSNEPSGIYFVTITNGNMTYTKKLVINH